jgi:hypothetical protein
MVKDVEKKKTKKESLGAIKRIRRTGREDLQDFRNWPIYVKAIDCGMEFPNKIQIDRYLKKGAAENRKRFFVVSSKGGER